MNKSFSPLIQYLSWIQHWKLKPYSFSSFLPYSCSVQLSHLGSPSPASIEAQYPICMMCAIGKIAGKNSLFRSSDLFWSPLITFLISLSASVCTVASFNLNELVFTQSQDVTWPLIKKCECFVYHWVTERHSLSLVGIMLNFTLAIGT